MFPIKLIKTRNKFFTFKFSPVILRKYLSTKLNCARWCKDVRVTLPDSVSSKEVEFEKILLINQDVLNILVVKSICILIIAYV